MFHDPMSERCTEIASYMLENGATVRMAAKFFSISKSTVHKDVSQRLKMINNPLYTEVKKILDENKSQRHIRGGIATKLKYEKALPKE